jgi:hypothetical protein
VFPPTLVCVCVVQTVSVFSVFQKKKTCSENCRVFMSMLSTSSVSVRSKTDANAGSCVEVQKRIDQAIHLL